MWQKVDVPKRFCYGERYFCDIKKGCKFFLNKNDFLIDLVGCQHLLKYSEHVVKRGCFEKPL